MELLVKQFSPASLTPLKDANILLSILFSNTLDL
jgi:hypothetical protein